MSRIFLSHSSKDDREAVALKQWLVERGLEAGVVTVDSALLRRALKPPGTIIGRTPRAGKDSGRL